MSDRKEKKDVRPQEAKREIVRKVLQYGMLAVLLGIAFILPAYGVNRYARENSEKRGMQQTEVHNLPEQSREDGSQDMEKQSTPETGEGPQSETEEVAEAAKGTIVIDAGHGGVNMCKMD